VLAALERVEKLLAFASDCNGRIALLDPFEGGKHAVAEVCRNVSCVGAEPIGLTDCLNFGSPERPEVMRQFARAIDGIAAACNALEVPIVSGNVSLYNETAGNPILPTPTMGVVGLVDKVESVKRAAFSAAGLEIVLLGPALGGPLGGSSWVAERTGEIKGPPPKVDLDIEARVQKLIQKFCRENLVESAHDVSEGGIAITLAECATATDPGNMVGATVELPAGGTLAEALFGEAASRIVVSVETSKLATVLARAKEIGVPAHQIGKTGGGQLVIRRGGPLVDVDLATLRDKRERCLEQIVGS
jgi:phosphoribosylformylglycinamidine synthase subunit PurL